MVRAVETDLDRPLEVEVARRQRPRIEGQEAEVALLGQGPEPPQEILGVAPGGQDAQQLVELELQPADLLAELRQALLGRSPLVDLAVEVHHPGLLAAELVLHLGEQKLVGGVDDDAQENYPHRGGDVPGFAFETGFNRHLP